MRKMFNKIAILIGVLSISAIAMVSCGSEKEMNLFNKLYINLNWDSNYEEIKTKVEKLKNDNMEVKLNKEKIEILDKNTESLDKIEFEFIEDELRNVKIRSNSKEVNSRKEDGVIFYYAEGIPVNSINVQKNFLNSNAIGSEDKDYSQKDMVTIYANILIDGSMYANEEFLKSKLGNNYKIERDDEKNTLKFINTLPPKSEILIKYGTERNEKNLITIENVVYTDKFGREASLSAKNGNVISFNFKKDKNSEIIKVNSFNEQLDLLKRSPNI